MYATYSKELNNDSLIDSNLEPRLIEYIKKRQFNKKNNINPEAGLLEKTYRVTKEDMAKIKNFMENKAMIHNRTEFMVKPEITPFESDMLLKDERLLKVKKKQERDKDAMRQRNNYNDIANSLDMYRKDSNFSSAGGRDFKTSFNPNVWLGGKNNEDSMKFEKNNPYNNEVSVGRIEDMKMRYSNRFENLKNKKPEIEFNNVLHWDDGNNVSGQSYSLDSIMGDMDTYNKKVSDNKIRDGFQAMFKDNNDPRNNMIQRDFNMDQYMCYANGGPTRKAKSLGYPNPFEHQFQYISKDIQDPDHACNTRPISARLFNKDVAKPYRNPMNPRAVMP